MFIYLITNLANGKYYVGKTSKASLDTYLSSACRSALQGKNNRPLLHRAIRKYGRDSFIIEPLTTYTTKAKIAKANSTRVWTEESRRRMSEVLKERYAKARRLAEV